MSRVERHAADEAEQKKQRKDRRQRSLLGGILNFVGSILMIVTILVCLGLLVPRFIGIQSYVVVSGSMEPEIPVGSMIFATEVDPTTIETGDIIVFFNEDGGDVPITHRVIENRIGDGEIVTKGDANNTEDLHPAAYVNVVGKVVWHVANLGRLASPLATVPGKIGVVLVVLAGYLLTEIGSRLHK